MNDKDQKLFHKTEIQATPEQLEMAEIFYNAQIKASTGPQLEGVIRQDALRVVQEPLTRWAEVGGVPTPILFKLECDSLAYQPYFEKREGVEGVYVLSPTSRLIEEQAAQVLAEEIFNDLSIKQIVTLRLLDPEVSGTEDGAMPSRLEEILLTYGMVAEPLLDANSGLPAEVIHFSGLPEFEQPLIPNGYTINETVYEMLQSGAFESIPQTGTTVLRPEYLTDELVEKIWNIYDKQIEILIEDHPAYQRLDRELVESMLRSPSGCNIVHFEEGEPVCIFIGVSELEDCEWLNASRIAKAFPDDDILYCPAMVTDFDRQGLNYSTNIFSLLVEIAMKRGKNIRPYFECTDISAQYVPNILENAIKATGKAAISVMPRERYQYVALKKP